MKTEQVVALAEQAYIYGYPTVDCYNVMCRQALNPASPEFRAPFNRIGHARNVATPGDRAIVAPNVDTPYSYAWLDLRAEPVMLTIPPFEEGRYVSLQLFDLYTYIVGYVTPRTNGNAGGDFLVAGPDWQGTPPVGIKAVFRVPTQLAFGLYRTQLFDPADITRVHAIQDQYKVQTLSEYIGTPPAPAAPLTDVEPIDVRKDTESLQYFRVLNAMLAYMPPLGNEVELREQLAGIGILPGAPFEPRDEEARTAVVQGMRAGLMQMYKRAPTVKSSAELFGSRAFLGQDYLIRAVGALLGIFGNAAEEYLGVGYQADADQQLFHGSHQYRIKFDSNALPPVGAFWSITVYTAEKFLYDNPINRYVINSPMLPSLQKDSDGGYTLYVQHASPGAGRESNWLPVPADDFSLTFRCYQPRKAILDGTWHAPPVVKVV